MSAAPIGHGASARAERLVKLYELRAQIEEEIYDLETRIAVDAERVRRARLKAARDAAKRTGKCGTDKGYYQHRKNGEPACRDCLEGHAEAERNRRVRREMRGEDAA